VPANLINKSIPKLCKDSEGFIKNGKSEKSTISKAADLPDDDS